jgi:ABC-type Na+ efflux pump permease subunit
MLIAEKKEFTKGAVLSITFFIVLAVMFSPVFKGENAFKSADKLFNSIAKGSSYYIPKVVEENGSYQGSAFNVSITLKSQEMAKTAEKLLTRAGVQVSGSDAKLKVTGDLGQVVKAALDDADAMFNNRGPEVSARYGYPEKEVLVTWWNALKEMVRDLTRQ